MRGLEANAIYYYLSLNTETLIIFLSFVVIVACFVFVMYVFSHESSLRIDIEQIGRRTDTDRQTGTYRQRDRQTCAYRQTGTCRQMNRQTYRHL